MKFPYSSKATPKVLRPGGKLNLSMKKIKVKAPYTLQFPNALSSTSTTSVLARHFQIGDLHFEGLELMNAKNAVVCAVQLTRAARGAQAKALNPTTY